MKEPRRWCARAGCRHAPSAHRGTGPCTLPGCDCPVWADRIRHWWRELVVDTWFWADHAWWLAMEDETALYATEMTEYREEHPRPLLKTCMIQLSRGEDPYPP